MLYKCCGLGGWCYVLVILQPSIFICRKTINHSRNIKAGLLTRRTQNGYLSKLASSLIKTQKRSLQRPQRTIFGHLLGLLLHAKAALENRLGGEVKLMIFSLDLQYVTSKMLVGKPCSVLQSRTVIEKATVSLER